MIIPTLSEIEARRAALKVSKRALAKAAEMNYNYLLQVYWRDKHGTPPTKAILIRLDAALPKYDDAFRIAIKDHSRSEWLQARAEVEGVSVDDLIYQLVGEVLSRGKGTTKGTTRKKLNAP